MDARPLSPCGETEQAAATADVEEAPAGEVGTPQHGEKRCLSGGDPRLVDGSQECLPVLAELESLAGGDFLAVQRGGRNGCGGAHDVVLCHATAVPDSSETSLAVLQAGH